jgi:hypothetical protein
MHVKFKIKSCQATAKMKFVDPVICDILTGYKLNSNDSIIGAIYAYDNIFRTDYSPISLCPIPKITGFSPAVIRAGTNEVLTITGTNFGASRGNGQILFADADSIGRYLKKCDTLDYVSWTNTEVKVKVPSIVFSDTLNPTAGSGIFKIVTNQGFRDSTTTKLDVQYAVFNSSLVGSSVKKRINIGYYNCNAAPLYFKLGNTLQNHPEALPLIDSAISTWSRFLNIDIRLQKDNYGNYQYFPDNNILLDTINIIYVKSYPIGTKTLMSTSKYSVACGNFLLKAGADIAINMNTTWHYGINDTKPSGLNDFYQSILHEIGHALNLGHTINPTTNNYMTEQLDLMTYAQTSNVQKLASERATLETGRQMAKTGSINIRDTSKAISWACSAIKKIREFSSPQSKTTCVGSAVSFTAFCERPTGSPAPSYTWQHFNTVSNQWVNTTTASLFTAVTGQISATLNITSAPISLHEKLFRCKISNVDGCTIYTQISKLSFNIPGFIYNPTSGTANENSNFSFFVESYDSTLQFKWQQKLVGSSVYNDINNGTYFSGTTTKTLSILNTPSSFDQNYFRCKAINTDGCIGYSAAAKLTVNPTGFAPGNPSSKLFTTELKANVYPNPSNNTITVNLSNGKDIQSIKVYNSNGVEVLSNTYNTNSATINISNFGTASFTVLYIFKS